MTSPASQFDGMACFMLDHGSFMFYVIILPRLERCKPPE